ncbi:G2/M phase-specific E3 ubiquitin-protein ligase, partial [Apaloderma vittatum]
QECFVCHQNGATVICSETGCQRSFHLPCAVTGKCVTQYIWQRRAFCSEHSPRQTVEAVPKKGTLCLICLEAVDDKQSFGTMVCPTCQHAWLHRHCVQGQAVSAGSSCFQCPLCRDRRAFQREMLLMGIWVP